MRTRPEGMADWVDAWSEDYGLTARIDACLIGGGMYPGYENYWTGIQKAPETPAWITGAPPTVAERDWAAFAARTPHYVLSNTITSVQWPQTTILTTVSDIAALKQQAGKDIYCMGGATLAASLMDEGLLDELRLIVYPLIAGDGAALFANAHKRRPLKLRESRALAEGRLSLIYDIG